jgi:hypothetical protein
MRTCKITMTESTEYTISDAMETMSDQDLAFIAAYNPRAMHSLCTMWSIELQLQKEGKLPSHPSVILKSRKSENWFVYLRRRFEEWLFSRLLKTVSRR